MSKTIIEDKDNLINLKISEESQYDEYKWLIENKAIDMSYTEFKEKSKTHHFGIVGQKGIPPEFVKKSEN